MVASFGAVPFALSVYGVVSPPVIRGNTAATWCSIFWVLFRAQPASFPFTSFSLSSSMPAHQTAAPAMQAGRWALAVETLEDMEASGLTPNEHNWLTAIGA